MQDSRDIFDRKFFCDACKGSTGIEIKGWQEIIGGWRCPVVRCMGCDKYYLKIANTYHELSFWGLEKNVIKGEE